MNNAEPDQALTHDERRQLCALLYRLSLVEMLRVVMEVHGRQQEGVGVTRRVKPTTKGRGK